MHMRNATCGARLSRTSRDSGRLMLRRLRSQRLKLTWKRRWGRVSSRPIIALNVILLCCYKVCCSPPILIAILPVTLVKLSTLSGHLVGSSHGFPISSHETATLRYLFLVSIYLTFKLIAGLLQHLRSRRLTSFSPCTVKGSGSQRKRRRSSKRSLTM